MKEGKKVLATIYGDENLFHAMKLHSVEKRMKQYEVWEAAAKLYLESIGKPLQTASQSAQKQEA